MHEQWAPSIVRTISAVSSSTLDRWEPQAEKKTGIGLVGFKLMGEK